MRTILTTFLDCSKERVWQEVQTVRLLAYIAAPMVIFEPLQPTRFPEIWGEACYQVRMKIFGRFSFGRHWIVISKPLAATGAFQLRDNGYGDRISKWDHWITIQDEPIGKTRLTNDVNIEAGLLTPIVWLFSQAFYRHRQRRWRILVTKNFPY
ncbi:MAG: hypothetical protein CL609_10235 [Anaerolineaceae bacterium]|nr:hypothetical protein [Anaerolineaceae bacterium]